MRSIVAYPHVMGGMLAASALLLACTGSEAGTAPKGVPPVVNLTLDASTAYVGLDSVKLSWTSQGSSACTADGAWSGLKAPNGSEVVVAAQAGAFDYGLECTGPGGSTRARSVHLDVSVLSHSVCGVNERVANIGKSGGPVQIGEYLPVNNLFSFSEVPGATACMHTEMTRPGILVGNWSWSIPKAAESDADRHAKGFQSVLYGRSVNAPLMVPTSSRLPSQIRTVPDSVLMDFDLELSRSGQFNTLVEIIVVPAANEGNVHTTILDIVTSVVGSDTVRTGPTMSSGGEEFWATDLHAQRPNALTPNDPTSYVAYAQFVSKRRIEKGRLVLSDFLKYAVSKGWIRPADYLLEFEFGTESDTGAGSANLRSFSVSWR